MTEMQQALKMLNGKLGLHLSKNPAGTWSFVGSVPVELRWNTNDPELIKTAINHGESLARGIAKRQGKTFKTCTWATEQEAKDAAAALGYHA